MKHTRRDFIRGTLAFSALAAAAPSLLALEPAKYKYCAFEKPVQFLDFDQVAELFANAGYDGIEAAVRDKGHVLPEHVKEELPRFHEALQKKGLEISILTSSINDVATPHAETTLREAAKLGIKRYRLLWYQYDLTKPILPQVDALQPKLKALAALNRELGMTGLYQNHSGDKMIGAPLWDLYGLIREFSPRELAFAYDIRHATVEGGLSWPINFNLIKSHLGAVCVKDFVWDKAEKAKVKNVPLGEGMVDKKFFTLLKQTPFDGPISVHVEYNERSKDVKFFEEAFKKDLKTLKALV
jgi:sugar phosphate isomerase/epimerase